MANINITELEISLEQIEKDEKLILVGVADNMEFVDSKPTGKRLGSKYLCVCPQSKYASINVKINDLKPIITQEQLDAATTPIMVTFEDFQGRFYKLRSTNDYAFTAKANKIVIVK